LDSILTLSALRRRFARTALRLRMGLDGARFMLLGLALKGSALAQPLEADPLGFPARRRAACRLAVSYCAGATLLSLALCLFAGFFFASSSGALIPGLLRADAAGMPFALLFGKACPIETAGWNSCGVGFLLAAAFFAITPKSPWRDWRKPLRACLAQPAGQERATLAPALRWAVSDTRGWLNAKLPPRPFLVLFFALFLATMGWEAAGFFRFAFPAGNWREELPHVLCFAARDSLGTLFLSCALPAAGLSYVAMQLARWARGRRKIHSPDTAAQAPQIATPRGFSVVQLTSMAAGALFIVLAPYLLVFLWTLVLGGVLSTGLWLSAGREAATAFAVSFFFALSLVCMPALFMLALGLPSFWIRKALIARNWAPIGHQGLFSSLSVVANAAASLQWLFLRCVRESSRRLTPFAAPIGDRRAWASVIVWGLCFALVALVATVIHQTAAWHWMPVFFQCDRHALEILHSAGPPTRTWCESPAPALMLLSSVWGAIAALCAFGVLILGVGALGFLFVGAQAASKKLTAASQVAGAHRRARSEAAELMEEMALPFGDHSADPAPSAERPPTLAPRKARRL